MLDDLRILIDEENQYIVKIDRDFQNHNGIVKKEELQKEFGEVYSHKNHKFYIFKPTLADIYNLIQRKSQVMQFKDIGFIISKTGINKNSKVLEAGTGNGTLTIFLGLIAKKVYSYEIKEDHYKTAKKNLELFNLKNVILKNKDISKGLKEKDFDTIVLDLPEPWKIIPVVKKNLKIGGFFAVYCPNLTQITKTIEEAKKQELKKIETKELIERTWIIEDDKILRPDNKELFTHTAFIVFLRKIKE